MQALGLFEEDNNKNENYFKQFRIKEFRNKYLVDGTGIARDHTKLTNALQHV